MAQREDIYWNTFLPVFFARVSDILKKEMTKELEPLGLTSAHGIYIMGLTLRDGQTMVGLSQFLDMDVSNTNHVIKVLRSKELVYDDRTSESSKKFKIYLTDKGKELGLHLMDFQTGYMNRYFNGISNEEIITLRNLLLKFLRNIDPDLDNYMLCRYQDPFYTYLHVDLGEDLPYHVMNHLKNKMPSADAEEEEKDSKS
ncbi:MAG: MarR family winged helix-turn-helix transcriptional regulator [Candidatus Methanoplasma sp.]|jgi:DNA-binding MarR family transcriptional regulator|nr:MarR family winged helix-turn-helix transcriptional regulator [Candidatus Methanoplasma sp.]